MLDTRDTKISQCSYTQGAYDLLSLIMKYRTGGEDSDK